MNSVVVDASTIGNILLVDEQDEQSVALLDQVTRADLVEPVHWPVESCGLLLKAVRRQKLKPQDRDGALAGALGIIALAEIEAIAPMSAIIELALAQHITIYDAAYLEIALRQGLPLLTSDGPLASAARKAGVSLVGLDGD